MREHPVLRRMGGSGRVNGDTAFAFLIWGKATKETLHP